MYDLKLHGGTTCLRFSRPLCAKAAIIEWVYVNHWRSGQQTKVFTGKNYRIKEISLCCEELSNHRIQMGRRHHSASPPP